MTDEQGDPPEIPPDDNPPAPPMDDAPSEPGAELLPPEDLKADGEGIGLEFDDLPEPPGGTPLDSAFSSSETEDTALSAVFDVPVKVQAVLGRARMPISELVSIHPGHVFELDRRVGEPIDLLVNDRLIARGEIVMIDGSLGVTLTEIVKQDA